MKWLISFVICLFATKTESQIRPQRQRQLPYYDIDKDQIYFEDNRPDKYELNTNSYQSSSFGVENNYPNTHATSEGGAKSNIGTEITNFSINLFKNMNSLHAGNMVLSPYSVATTLALLQQGAQGQTLQQIARALHMSPVTTRNTFKEITDSFQRRTSRNTLKSANNIFLADSFYINQQFQQIARSHFWSDVTPIGFGSAVLASQTINSWVSSKTNHKINNLLRPDSVDASTVMALVNAVYFKGIWDSPFGAKSTRPGHFTLPSGQTKTVQYMHQKRPFRARLDRNTGEKVIVLPFENNEYSLIVIVPPELQTVSEAISSLTSEKLDNCVQLSRKDVQLEMPKFTIKANTNLAPVLKQMGITKIFQQGAELVNIGRYQSYSPIVSSAVHSAVLTIDEDGGQAAAATSFSAVALSNDPEPFIFRVNRPFIAVLWDTTYSIPVFMAKVEDPVY